MTAIPGQSFTLTPATRILVGSDSPGVMGAATALAEILRPSTGYPFPVSRQGDQSSAQSSHRPRASNLNWSTRQSSAKKATDSTSPPEQSSSARTQQRASSTAWRHCGSSSRVRSRATLCSPARGLCRLHVTDEPRFAWRGAMLDAARHFFSVEKVKRYIDLLAMCKINVLHLHLADEAGASKSTAGRGSQPTAAARRSAEAPAATTDRSSKPNWSTTPGSTTIMVVSEIDMPGHTNAALASYGELNCDGEAPPLYTGTGVGFSSLCIAKPITYRFIDDVVRELSAMAPGPYIHIGGDEAHSTPHEDYVTFVNRVEDIVSAHGKDMLGWEEITGADVSSSSVAQHQTTPTHGRQSRRA